MVFWSRRKKPVDKVILLSGHTRGEGPVVILDALPDDVAVPPAWSAFVGGDAEGRVKSAIAQWKSAARKTLPDSIMFFEDCLQEAELMRVGRSVYVLYTLGNRYHKTVYFVGGNPLARRVDGLDWPRVPPSIRAFYDLHDGFFDYTTRVGFNPLADVVRLRDLDWGVVDDLGLDVKINLDTSYGFFFDKSGAYVVADLDDWDDGKGALWCPASAPAYDLDFWHSVDGSLVLSLSSL
jgi:hypothetical protein